MRGVTALVGVGAAVLIAAGVDFSVAPSSVSAALLELSGVIMAVAFFGLADGA